MEIYIKRVIFINYLKNRYHLDCLTDKQDPSICAEGACAFAQTCHNVIALVAACGGCGCRLPGSRS
ncbi:hypothetical protein MPLA_140012 [Mesorhizobium sp. ORS 3359]|nr:hypothetical protein MPLA_140012 [Mesorhizobium sp. ORS 3359]